MQNVEPIWETKEDVRVEQEGVMDDRRELDPNYGDDLPKVCPSCCRAKHCFITDYDGVTCPCGHLIEGGE